MNAPLIQSPLLFIERLCASQEHRINRKPSVLDLPASIAPLDRGVVSNPCIDLLKLDQIFRLLLLHSQERQNLPAYPCGFLCGYAPDLLGSMLWSIWVLNVIHDQAATKDVVQKRNGLWFAHRNGDCSRKRLTIFSSTDADAAFAIDNSGGVGKIRKIEFGHWICSLQIWWSWLMRRLNTTSALFILRPSFRRCACG